MFPFSKKEREREKGRRRDGVTHEVKTVKDPLERFYGSNADETSFSKYVVRRVDNPASSRILSEYRWFELDGVPFSLMSFEDKKNAVESLKALFETTPFGVLYVRNETVRYSFGRGYYHTRSPVYYLGTSEDVVPYFGAKKLDENPLHDRPAVAIAKRNYLRLGDGTYVAPMVLCGTTGRTLAAYVYSVLPYLSEFFLFWRNYGPVNSYGESDKLAKRYSSFVKTAEQTKSARSVALISKRIVSDGCLLLDTYTLFFVRGDTLKELKDNVRLVKSRLNECGVIVDRVPAAAEETYYLTKLGNLFVPIVTDTLSAATCFPLVAEGIVDPGGVYLGVSGTNRPVVLNVFRKKNPMVVILGMSGSGKSTTAKAFISRMVHTYSIPVYGIDPEGEYTNPVTAKTIGFERVHVIEEGETMGLDPFKQCLMGAIPETTLSDLLIHVYDVPPRKTALLRKYVSVAISKGVSSIYEFYEGIDDEELRSYLASVDAAPDRFIYRGKPPDLSKSIVFALGKLSDRSKVMVSALLTSYVFRKLYDFPGRKMFFVDEAWLFVNVPSIMGLLGELSRRGRKRGISLVLTTQRVQDISRCEEGRSVLEQASTKILFGHTRESADTLKDVFKLTDDEVSYLTSPPPRGSGLICSDGIHSRISVVLTREELEAFSTESSW